MLPETNNEPGAENDAAKEEDDAKERPKEHHVLQSRFYVELLSAPVE